MNKKILVGLCVVGVLAVSILAGVLAWRARVHRWKWEAIPMPERFARVPAGWSAETLAKRLKATKKIRDADAFLEAAAQANLKIVKAGGYLLPKKAGPQVLAERFARGPTHQKATFPEGWTVEQMSTRLQSLGFKAAPQLRALAYPKDKPISSLEGFLFPDTYWLRLDSTAPQLEKRLRARFDEVASTLPRSFPLGENKKPLTLREVVILASLVERETDVPNERALVAGVLLKRLREKMRLQCDASVQYALQRAASARGESTHQTVTRASYKFPSPYNTYLNAGLPPAPICNPGKESLIAAARPRATDYLFYVWSPKLKRHRFAKTFEEHKKNIALAKLEK